MSSTAERHTKRYELRAKRHGGKIALWGFLITAGLLLAGIGLLLLLISI